MKKPLYLLFALLLLILILPFCVEWYKARVEKEGLAQSAETAESAGLAMQQYADDHQGRWPDAAHWETDLAPYLRRRASEPPFDFNIASHPGDRLAMNTQLSSGRQGSLANPDSTPLLYETNSMTRNASGIPPWPAYYGAGPGDTNWRMVVFADGYATACSNHPMAGGKMR